MIVSKRYEKRLVKWADISVVPPRQPGTFTWVSKLGSRELKMMSLYPNIDTLQVIRGQERGQD